MRRPEIIRRDLVRVFGVPLDEVGIKGLIEKLDELLIKFDSIIVEFPNASNLKESRNSVRKVRARIAAELIGRGEF